MNTKKSGKLCDRDGAVELLRVLLVFGICLLHSFGQSAVKCRMGEQVLLWVVDAFVFISGWYGYGLAGRNAFVSCFWGRIRQFCPARCCHTI